MTNRSKGQSTGGGQRQNWLLCRELYRIYDQGEAVRRRSRPFRAVSRWSGLSGTQHRSMEGQVSLYGHS